MEVVAEAFWLDNMRALFPKSEVLKAAALSFGRQAQSFFHYVRTSHPRVFWFKIALAVSVLFMVTIDPHVTFFVRYDVPEPIKAFFRAITDFAKGVYWYQAIAVWFSIAAIGMIRSGTVSMLKEWRYQARLAYFFLCAMIASGLTLVLAKFVIGRHRPRYLWREDLYGFQPFNFDFSALSYPSGHTQVIFCVATVFAILWPRVTIPFYCVAAFFGMSRVMVNAHYVSDIVMGAFVGVVVTLLVRDYFNKTGETIAWRNPLAKYKRA